MSTSQRRTGAVALTLGLVAGAMLVGPRAVPGAAPATTPTDPSPSEVVLVADGVLGKPAGFGVARLERALHSRGVRVRRATSLDTATSHAMVFGTSASAVVRDLSLQGLEVPRAAEALAVKRMTSGGTAILAVAGRDDTGLMYAALELAQQLEALPASASWWPALRETVEKPAVPVRGIRLLLHNADDERGWYYSKEFWDAYLGMLAADRWNSFNLVFSHQTPYLTPMYPFHVTVPEHPGVRASGLSDADRAKNLEMLQYIASTARDRGLAFTLGIWQQITWSGKNQGSKQPSMVDGYSRSNMRDYTYRALSTLLRAVPAISTLQLRVNHESGLDYDEQTAFFRDAVFRAVKEAGRPIVLDMRDVGLLIETIDAAVASGLSVRVNHKYWGEHMVFPYHPTKVMWTYSYGDWLEYPQRFQNLSEVWSLGSHRLLSWGHPEFVRRFAPTTAFEDSVGFTVDAPLSQKGYGNAPGAWRIFRDARREYYRWEFERYWSFYRLYGRLTYDPGAGDDLWLRELRRRFGSEAADPVAAAYRAASEVVSRISGASLANYNMPVWPEKDMGGLIDYYIHLKPFDQARFRSFTEYASDELSARGSGRVAPPAVAARFERIADDTDQALARAAALIPPNHEEWWATAHDFRILSGMARYHARKSRAATALTFFYRLGDVSALSEAITHAEAGLDLWMQLSREADEIYSPNLVFGPVSVGHWTDNLVFVEHDLRQLRAQATLFDLLQNFDYGFDFGPRPFTSVIESYSSPYTNDFTVDRRFTGVFPHSAYSPGLGYGWVDPQGLKANEIPQVPLATWRAASKRDTAFPPEALLGDFISGREPALFRMDLPEGLYQATLVMTDRRGEATDHGPFSVTVVERFGERPILTGTVVKKGDTLVTRFNFNMVGDRFSTFRVRITPAPGADFIVNAFTVTRVEPHIAHRPVRRTEPGRDLKLAATVTLPPPVPAPAVDSLSIARGTLPTLAAPDRLARVTLHYRTSAAGPSRTLEMAQVAPWVYAATVPARDVGAETLLYTIEAMDSTGQVVQSPGRQAVASWHEVDVTSDVTPPALEHSPVTEHGPGRPLEIRARVTDAAGVEEVRLHYRPTRHKQEFSTVRMRPVADSYVAAIPGPFITERFDLMYYFEVLDRHGNGAIVPDPEVAQPYHVVRIRRGPAAGPSTR